MVGFTNIWYRKNRDNYKQHLISHGDVMHPNKAMLYKKDSKPIRLYITVHFSFVCEIYCLLVIQDKSALGFVRINTEFRVPTKRPVVNNKFKFMNTKQLNVE